MAYENIPTELTDRRQWCLWRYEQAEGEDKPTKVPYSLSGHHASSTDSRTWNTFDAVVAAVHDGKADGIGYFFSASDPYVGIDLDDPYEVLPDGQYKHANPQEVANRHQAILQAFDTYAELSPSLKGVHIIGRGDVEHGRRRDGVEIYSVARYFTFTGKVVKDRPIADVNNQVNSLWHEMSPPRNDSGYRGTVAQNHEDAEVYDMAAKAANGDKFVALYNGDYQQYYSSQSEADFALIDIIAFYSEHQMQIARMFRDSALGKRSKAERDSYVFDMIGKSFDNHVPLIDMTELLEKLAKDVAELERAKVATAPKADASPAIVPVPPLSGTVAGGVIIGASPANSFNGYPTDIHLKKRPPGILDMIVDYTLSSSPVPIYETALVSALGMVAGIAGRQYNISKTGLNMYLMFIANTGMGKETISSSISRLLSAVAFVDPTNVAGAHLAARDVRGPAEVASGQALLKYLASAPRKSFVSLTGEFGLKLQQITSPNAGPADVTLKRVLLDLFGKSGEGQSVEPSIYADKDKNTEAVISPAFTMVGESTGETFYAALDEASVAVGLLPRFTVIEYTGEQPPFNYGHEDALIPEQLRIAISDFIAHVDGMTAEGYGPNGFVYKIPTTEDAAELLREVLEHQRYQQRQSNKEAYRQLWNRVHLKVLRLAGLLAVSQDYRCPRVTREMVEWAHSLILSDAVNLQGRFDRGEMGEKDETSDDAKMQYITGVIGKYLQLPFGQLPKYRPVEKLHANAVVNLTYLSMATNAAAPFRKDKRGQNVALRETVRAMCEHGDLREVQTNQAQKDFDFGGKCYAIVNPKKFLTGL